MSKTLSIFAAFALAATAFAQEKAADAGSFIRKSFDVGAGGKLTIRADRGTIEVKTGATDKVEVEVTREPSGRGGQDMLAKHTVDFKHEGKDVSIKAELPGMRMSIFGGSGLKVKYAVTVPAKYNVDLQTAGGSVTVQDLEGEARAHTSGGSLRFGEIKGRVYGRTSGGSIKVIGATEDVDVETSGGGIDIGDTGGKVVARTSGGSIKVGNTKGAVTAETSGGGIDVAGVVGPITARTSGGSIRAAMTAQPTGPCTLGTSGGGIELRVAENVKIDLDAETSGGTVKTDLPVTVQGEMKRNQLRSKVNGGGPKVTLNTSGGGINIRKL